MTTTSDRVQPRSIAHELLLCNWRWIEWTGENNIWSHFGTLCTGLTTVWNVMRWAFLAWKKKQERKGRKICVLLRWRQLRGFNKSNLHLSINSSMNTIFGLTWLISQLFLSTQDLKLLNYSYCACVLVIIRKLRALEESMNHVFVNINKCSTLSLTL